MENINITKVYKTTDNLSEDFIQKIKDHFNGLADLKILDFQSSHITLEFNPYIYSEAFLLSEVRKIGFTMRPERKRRNIFMEIIENLIKDNKKSFGNKRMNCCDLNKQNKPT